MVKGFLRQMLVVEPDVAVERLFKVFGAIKVMRAQHLFEPPVETLNHPVGLRGSGLVQAMIDAQRRTQGIKLMSAGGVFGARAEQTVGEFLAVIRQDRLNLERRGLGHPVEKRADCGRGLVPLDGDEHPARRPVDGHEHITARGFVRHLRQVLHIDMQEARNVGLEQLGRTGGFLRHRQSGMPAAPEQAIKRRAAHGRFDEFLDDGQQVIEGQAQLRAQVDHQLFLPGVQGGLQAVHGMAAVLDRVAPAPAADRLARNVELPRQFVVAAGGFLDRRADRRRGRGVLVQGNQHEAP